MSVPLPVEIPRDESSHLPYSVAAPLIAASKVGSALAGATAQDVEVAVVVAVADVAAADIHAPGRRPAKTGRTPDIRDTIALRRLDMPGPAPGRRIAAAAAAAVLVELAADGSHGILLHRRQERTRPRRRQPRKWLPLRLRGGRRRRGCEISSLSELLRLAKRLQ